MAAEASGRRDCIFVLRALRWESTHIVSLFEDGRGLGAMCEKLSLSEQSEVANFRWRCSTVEKPWLSRLDPLWVTSTHDPTPHPSTSTIPIKYSNTGLSSNMQSVQDEESLPLYSNLEFDDLDTSGPLTLPEAAATPDEVRTFLVRLLMTNRSLPLDQARRIAARWNMGSGRELWMYSSQMYNVIFGPEDGWVLYKDVKVMYLNTKRAKKSFVRRYITGGSWFPVILISSFNTSSDIFATAFLLLGISIGIWISAVLQSDSVPEEQIAIAASGIVFSVIGFMLTGSIACVEHFRSFEREVERELQAGFFNSNNNNNMLPRSGAMEA